jgi:predicted transcriptional regulator
MKEKIVRITIRFPESVAKDLHALAEDEERSVNWEVVEAAKQRVKTRKGSKDAAR